MAWSPDLTKMYVSKFNDGTVYSIDPAGVVVAFATGLTGPVGLLTTQDGRLLVAESSNGEITDITAGGSFSGAAPFASGLSAPIDLAQRPDGRIFAAEFNSQEVSEITAGGAVGAGQVLASGINGAYDLMAEPTGNDLLVTAAATNQIVSISPTGATTLIGVGHQMEGLAVARNGHLLGSDQGNDAVWEISTGRLFASVIGVNNIETVPVPEPAGLLLLAAAPIFCRKLKM